MSQFQEKELESVLKDLVVRLKLAIKANHRAIKARKNPFLGINYLGSHFLSYWIKELEKVLVELEKDLFRLDLLLKQNNDYRFDALRRLIAEHEAGAFLSIFGRGKREELEEVLSELDLFSQQVHEASPYRFYFK